MKILLVDDEPLARDRLRRLLAAHSDCEVVAEAENGQQASQLCQQLQPDLVLLDIEMPGQNGLELARSLADLALPPALVFVTAHPEHALNAFQCAAAGYLVKPVVADELEQLLKRITKPTRVQLEAGKEQAISYQLAGVTRQLPLSCIRYLIAEDKYVRIVSTHGEAIIEQSLRQLELQYLQLLRIHRKILINKDHFVALHQHQDGYQLELADCSERLNVSRREASKLRQVLKKKQSL